jgi:hypothetical protein
MYDIDSLFSDFSDPEMIPVMKRVFDETAAVIHAWGCCGTIFADDEAEEVIAHEILTLAEEGVRGRSAMSASVLTRIGAAALDKVCETIEVAGRPSPEGSIH